MLSTRISRPQFAASDDSSSPYYFLHIPKTAGSTLNQVLDGLFNDFEICSHFGWTELLNIPRDALGDYKLFRGYLYGYLHRYVEMPLRYFTFLRDPVDRALSHYSHILRDENHYMRQRTLALGSFGAFIRDPETRNLVVNFQVRAIALDFDPVTHAAKLSENELGR